MKKKQQQHNCKATGIIFGNAYGNLQLNINFAFNHIDSVHNLDARSDTDHM